MSKFEERIKKDLASTPFNDVNRRNILKVVLGELQRKPVNSKDVSDDAAYGVVKGMIKSNEELMKCITSDHRKYVECENENEILKMLLPAYLSEEEIRCLLQTIDVKSMNEGKAIGIAMKYLKESGLSVEGETVKKAVLSIR